MTAVIEARGLRFGYGPTPVLDRLDLALRSGEFAVLTGPNGSGKSTLLKCLVGLLRAHAGQVLVLGEPVSSPAARRRIGYAPQGSSGTMVLPVSVSEVVAAGVTGLGTRASGEGRAIANALDAVGLAPLAGECVFELSGGEQQRAVIARALVGDRPVLILDEPTTGIDPAFRPRLVEELRRRADAGTAVLVVSHDPEDFHDVVDRILFMEDGRVRDVSHVEYHAEEPAT